MITNFEELKNKYGNREYALPGWDFNSDFVCKLKRPSLVDMTAVVGFVPNPLMGTVADLFMPTTKKMEKMDQEKQARALQLMAKFALQEPTYDQLAEAGIALTDEQYNAIYAFALGGAAGLDRFRQLNRREPGNDGAAVSAAPVAAGGD
jgi:hypothetical protein